MSRLSSQRVAICGAGALGSNLAVHLARQGVARLTLIDRDRVEIQNIGTQVFAMDDVGALKAEMLRNIIFRDLGEELTAVARELDAGNAQKLLRNHDLVVDAFDNAASRLAVKEACLSAAIPCLHIGVNEAYGEIRWNESYLVPSDAQDDVCDYPLARNLILLVVAAASEVVVRFLLDGSTTNLSITLGDLKINQEEG